MQRFKMIASGYVLFIRDGKILLIRRAHTGYEDGKYSLPAGHVEDGESISQNAIREAREEIGVTIDPRDLLFVHVMHRRETDIRMDFFFVSKTWKGEPVNKEPNRCDDVRWFDLDALPSNIIPYIRDAIEKYKENIYYSERGWV